MKQTDEHVDFIWYNNDIRIGKKIVYCANMFQGGLWTVHDLFNEDGSLVSFDVWESRGVQRKHYIIWRGLVQIASKVERSFLSEKYRHLNRGYIELEDKRNFY